MQQLRKRYALQTCYYERTSLQRQCAKHKLRVIGVNRSTGESSLIYNSKNENCFAAPVLASFLKPFWE